MLAGNRWYGLAAQGANEAGLADAQQAAIDQALQALPGMAVDRLRCARCLAERTGDGVFRTVFQCGGQRQAIALVEIAQRMDGLERQAAFGQRTGLVQHQGVDLVQAFEHMAAGQ